LFLFARVPIIKEANLGHNLESETSKLPYFDTVVDIPL
jgi:hypothetical protein